MDFQVKITQRNTSDDDLIKDVVLTAKKLQVNTLTITVYNEHGCFNASTLIRRFGSWSKVLEMAQLSPSRSPINISNHELFDNFKKVWIYLGRQPRYSELHSPLSLYSSSTYTNRFGSWNSMLVAFEDYINSDTEDDLVCTKVEGQLLKSNLLNIHHKTKREISDRLRFKILMRDGFTCKSCGKSPINELGVELHVDHIIPWSMGGETVEDNLITKCKQCNLGKGNAFDK